MFQISVSRMAGAFLIVTMLIASVTAGTAVILELQGIQRVTQSTIVGKPDYVVVIMLENHGINNIIGNRSAPYMNQLATSYSLAIRYTALTHPSLSNYLAIMLGSLPNCRTDPNPNSGCATLVWKNQTLVDNLELHNRTWKAYMESMPSNCYTKNANATGGKYYARHNPFVYFDNIVNNPARCNRVVPAGVSDSTLLSDLSSTTTASNLMWLTPNGCNDMHDCGIATGDNYLKGLVPKILDSTLFKTQNAALFITFDEGTNRTPSDYVYTVWAGPVAKTKFESSLHYDHYSFLKTLETFWGLPTMSIGDAGATPMTEFFASAPPPPIQPNFNYSPLTPLTNQSISFTGTAEGGQAPYSFKWNFGDNTPTATSQAVAHSYTKQGSYKVTFNVSDSLKDSAVIVQTITVTNLPLPLSVSIDYSPFFPSPEDNVSFTGIARGGTFPYTYSWNLGDEVTRQGQTVYRQYTEPGHYNVTLTAADSKNKLASTNLLLNVTNAESLTAIFYFTPSEPEQGTVVSFTATATGGDPPYAYAWNMGDGTTMSGALVSHRYSTHGIYNVSLATTDSSGVEAAVSKTVQVNRPLPHNPFCSFCPPWLGWLPFVGLGAILVVILATVSHAVRARKPHGIATVRSP